MNRFGRKETSNRVICRPPSHSGQYSSRGLRSFPLGARNVQERQNRPPRDKPRHSNRATCSLRRDRRRSRFLLENTALPSRLPRSSRARGRILAAWRILVHLRSAPLSTLPHSNRLSHKNRRGLRTKCSTVLPQIGVRPRDLRRPNDPPRCIHLGVEESSGVSSS